MPTGPVAAAILLSTGAFGIVYGLWPTPLLLWPTALSMLVTGITLWPHTRRQTRSLAGAFILVALAGTYWSSFNVAIEGATRIAELIAMLLAAQILNDAIAYGGYDRSVRVLLTNLRWPPTWTAVIGGYLLTWGFSLTAMPLIYSSLYGSTKTAGGKSYHAGPGQVTTAILLARAFAAAAIAAPIQPTVLLAVAISDASLISFLAWVVPMTWLILLAAFVDRHRREQQDAIDLTAATAGTGTGSTRLSRRQLVLLTGLFASLVIATVTVSVLPVRVIAGMSAVVSLAAFTWGPLGRKLLLNGMPPEPGLLRKTASNYTKRMADGVLLIGAGGIAGFILTHTPLMDFAAALLRQITLPAAAAVLTIAVVIGLRLLGVAPAVIIITVGPVLKETLPLSNVALAALLSAGSGMAFVLSPFSITSAMASSLTGRSPVEVSLSRQAVFAALGSLAAAAYVAILM